ncbi:MAG: fibronectin type III domain-containing protein [Verrucomicrobiales bacterium]|nr:fibronectin type III domain-containing protein [Verrucomicrobiales bacterium]
MSRTVSIRSAVFGVQAMAVLSLLGLPGVSDAQLFGGNGLLNRKTEAPRDLTEQQIGLPTPVTGRVEVLKGTETTFEIRAETKTPAASVEFLIRTFPSAGKIVSLTSNPNARNRAIVTYFADPNTSATSDAFAFAVRYRNGRYSSAMRFDIDLIDTQAEIQVDKEVDFGSVMIGESKKQEITVRNLGNAVFERQIFLSPPWYLLEPKDGKLTLGSRGSRKLTVSFRPDMMGETSYFLSLSRSSAGTTKLLGEGQDPFSIVSGEVELLLDSDDYSRKGEVILKNDGTRPLLVQARGSARLQQSLEEEYVLGPETETRVPLSLGSTDTAPFDGMVQFSLKNGYMKTARVISAVVPGRLEIDIPDSINTEVINFGKVEAGRSTERALTLTNRGGIAVPLEFHLPEPFRMLNDPGAQLAPLSSVNIAIGLYPVASQRGLVDVTMNVYGNEQSLPVRLLGNVLKGAGAAASTARPAPAVQPLQGLRLSTGAPATPKEEPKPMSVAALNSVSDHSSGGESKYGQGAGRDELWYKKLSVEEREELRSPLGHITRAAVERKLNPDLRRPEDLSVVSRSADSLTIGWTAPKDSEGVRFEVELGGMQVAEGAIPTKVWVPYQKVNYERIDRLVKAEIKGLAPAASYELRVLTLDEEGRSSPPSEALLANTDLPMDWTYIYIFFGLLVIAGVIFGIVKVYSARRPDVYQARFVDS